MFLSSVWALILTAPIHFRGSTGDATFIQICSETDLGCPHQAWLLVSVNPIQKTIVLYLFSMSRSSVVAEKD